MSGVAAIFDPSSYPILVVNRWHRESSRQEGRGRREWTSLAFAAGTVIRMATTSPMTDDSPRRSRRRPPPSPTETRLSLIAALASQTFSASQRLLGDLATETWRYVFPRRMAEARNLEEMLMSVPDLETVRYKVLSRTEHYEIREVEPYFVAETTMAGSKGFDFSASSQAFNVLAAYLFGKNIVAEKMEMTMPVYVQKGSESDGQMEMTTPVITKESRGQEGWRMSFVMPSKYGDRLPLPKDSSVRITEVPGKIVAVSAFSGFVTDEEVKRRESKLRNAVKNDKCFQIKDGSLVEVAQFNPPFTPPFMRRNEIALEVESKDEQNK